MAKLLGVGAALWLVVFAFRVILMGGIDPTYRDQEVKMLSPLRQQLEEVIDKTLPYPQSALLSGILLGSQNNLPFKLKNDLKTTSTIHMVVVSGQNLSMVAGFVMSLVYFLGRRKTIVLTLLAVAFYSLLTGFQVPVIRAGIMVFLAYLAQLLGRERQGPWVLFLTAGLMLLYNPNWLLSISFQLSFLATFGVIVVAPVIASRLKKVPKVLREDLGVTLSAQFLVLPVIAYNFGQISLIGILVNSLILWSIPLVMIFGFIGLGLGMVNTFLGQVAGLVPGILLTYFIDMVQFFAKIPGSSLVIGETGIILWLGYYLIIGALIWILRVKGDGAQEF